MQKNTVQWVVGLSGVMVILLINSILYPSMRHIYDVKILSTATILNVIAFLVGYSILKPLKTLAFWKFATYTATITGVNWFLFSMRIYDWSLPLVGRYFWFFCFALPFAVSILLNIGFLKFLFGMTTRTAILMGVLIGLTDAQSLIVSFPVLSNPGPVTF